MARPRLAISASRLFDVGLALALTVAGVAEVLVPFTSRQGHGSALASCLGVVLRGVALTQRRTRPMLGVLAVMVTFPLCSLLGGTYVLFYGQAVMIGVALYAVVRHAPPRDVGVGVGATAVTLVLADLTIPQLQEPNEIAFHWSVAALVVAAALSLRRLARRAQESLRRAVEAEVASAEQAMAAVVEERARIARELHDIVAHAVSTIVVQAGAAEQVVEDDPALARASLESIRSTGASALAEMRRLVTVLRDDDSTGPLEPQPGLAALPALVEAMRAAGLEVEVRSSGESRPLPAGLDLAAYRIVQEGLTNARRHSAAGRAVVCLRYAAEELRIEVSDPGPAVSSPPESGGHGLVGIRQRVGLYGGEMSAGPDGRSGFSLAVQLVLAP